MNSVYQFREWAEVCKKSRGWTSLYIDNLIFFEKDMKLPLLGKKKILFAEGVDIELLKNHDKTKTKKYHDILFSTFSYDGKLKGFYETNMHTITIDLSKPLDELWTSLEKKSIRWGIKKAEAEGVIVKDADSEKELEEFYQMYISTCHQGGLIPEKYEFFSSINDILVPKKLAKILVAKKNGKVVSGAILLISQDYTTLNLTGTNDEGQKSQANVLVYWELIKFSKEIGRKWFDLGGYDVYAKSGEKAYFVNRFKKRWGGQIIRRPIYTHSATYFLALRLARVFRGLLSFWNRHKLAETV